MASLLGDKIKTLRKNKKLTLEGLASEAGVSKSYLWELENREAQKPSVEILEKLAKALDVSIAFFLEEETSLTPEEKHLDDAFFRNYQKLGSAEKDKLRKIMEVFQEQDNSNDK